MEKYKLQIFLRVEDWRLIQVIAKEKKISALGLLANAIKSHWGEIRLLKTHKGEIIISEDVK